jgi:hypothetical protein
MKAEHHSRYGHLRSGISSGHERIRLTVGLEADSHRHGIVWLSPQRGSGLVGHTDVVRRFDNRDSLAHRRTMRELAAQQSSELLFYWICLADKLNCVVGAKLGKCLQRSSDSCPGRVIAPHGVQRDARQTYASLAATRCSPS